MNHALPQRWPLAIDSLVLLLLIGFLNQADPLVEHLVPYALPALAVYILLDLLAYAASLEIVSFRPGPRLTFTVKLAIIWLLIAVFVAAPTLLFIIGRHVTEPHLFVHDGQIQTEEAMRTLLLGKNPYTEDYTRTAMVDWPFRAGTLTVNPALYHNPYLPATFALPIPLYLALQSAMGWYDQRILHLIAFFALLLLAPALTERAESKLGLILVLGLNPLFVPFFIEGRNDVLILVWLLLATLLLKGQHFHWASVAMGLACATKQTAWFFVPFFLLASASGTTWAERIRTALWRALPAGLCLAAGLVPFVVWDARAFLDDTFRFMSGSLASGYPASGMGFSVILVQLGLTSQNHASMPMWILQLGVAVPALAFLLWVQWRVKNLGWLWISYGTLMATVSFFGWVFHANYLGIVLNALLVGCFAGPWPSSVEQQPEKRNP